jgi:hypothetical protein
MIWGWWVELVAVELQQFWEDLVDGKRPKIALMAPPQHGKSWTATDFIGWMIASTPHSGHAQLGVAATSPVHRQHHLIGGIVQVNKHALANVIAVCPSTDSARWIVARLTPDSRTRSAADQRRRARLAIEVVLRNGRVLRLPEGVTPGRAVGSNGRRQAGRGLSDRGGSEGNMAMLLGSCFIHRTSPASPEGYCELAG